MASININISIDITEETTLNEEQKKTLGYLIEEGVEFERLNLIAEHLDVSLGELLDRVEVALLRQKRTVSSGSDWTYIRSSSELSSDNGFHDASWNPLF